jgi:nucleoside-diphosphate-sugar epimerase
MIVVVTGAAGYIGGHIALLLQDAGAKSRRELIKVEK